MKKSIIIINLLIFSFLIFSCQDDEKENRIERKIEELYITSDSIVIGSYVKLTCFVDFESDSIFYNWECNEGKFFNKDSSAVNTLYLKTNEVLWKAPQKTGNFIIKCNITLSDRSILDSKETGINTFFPDYNDLTTILSEKRLLYNGVFHKNNFYTIISPVYDYYNNQYIKTKEEQILQITNDELHNCYPLSYSDYFLTFSNSFIQDTIDENPCYITFTSYLNTEIIEDEIYISNHNMNHWVKKLDLNNMPYLYNYIDLYNILDLEKNKNDELFAITSPLYDENLNLITPPIIWLINDNLSFIEYFRFPENYDFNGTDYASGNGRGYFPGAIKYSMAFDTSNNLFIAMPFSNKIYKIDTMKNITIFADDIFGPSSMVIGDNNYFFIISSPSYRFENWKFEQIKPLEIIMIDTDGNKKIIHQSDFRMYNYGSAKEINPNEYVSSGSFRCNLFLSDSYKLYFLDSGQKKLFMFY